MAEPLTWHAASAAEDLLFEGLFDALACIGDSKPRDAAIIGGVMVELLIRERALPMSRATKDVDLGIHVLELRRVPLVAELEKRQYERREGHLFLKQSGLPDGYSRIDVLVPSYKSRQSQERQIGEITTIEVGMLSEALETATYKVVRLATTSGTKTELRVPLPNPLAALTLKLSGWAARRADKDAFDIWRCLEVCGHDGMQVTSWKAFSSLRCCAERLRAASFAMLDADGVAAAVRYARLRGDAAQRRAARIVVLGNRLFGTDMSNA
jgi:hypothetical protein